ncbi:hypothetical protein COOONC_04145, partial [Cooperia oncophora]
ISIIKCISVCCKFPLLFLQIGKVDRGRFELERRGFLDDGFGRRPALYDERERSLRSAIIEYPGFPKREEDWRSSGHPRRPEPVVESPMSWKRGLETHSWASERTEGSDNWRRERDRSPSGYDDWKAGRLDRGVDHRLLGAARCRLLEGLHLHMIATVVFWKRDDSSLSKGRHEKTAGKHKSPEPREKGSITNLSEDELEKMHSIYKTGCDSDFHKS